VEGVEGNMRVVAWRRPPRQSAKIAESAKAIASAEAMISAATPRANFDGATPHH
jgi:hypothetical protein